MTISSLLYFPVSLSFSSPFSLSPQPPPHSLSLLITFPTPILFLSSPLSSSPYSSLSLTSPIFLHPFPIFFCQFLRLPLIPLSRCFLKLLTILRFLDFFFYLWKEREGEIEKLKSQVSWKSSKVKSSLYSMPITKLNISE